MKFFLLLSQLFLCHVSRTAVIPSKTNNRPIIAVLAQLVPTDSRLSYIAASYVKLIESAGGRAVLIPTSFEQEEVRKLFSYVNGVLFPGGGIRWSTSRYFKNAKVFYDLAIEANKDGDYFPILGVCLGFETLHVLTANDVNVLSEIPVDDKSIPLNFTKEIQRSRIFGGNQCNIIEALSSQNITYNLHTYGVSPKSYKIYPVLEKFYKILSTNFGENGKEFISTIEARDYPFYGTQWHPEKAIFEFNMNEQISHSQNAILASQYVANFFVGEARKNFHHFPSLEEERRYLSYNYNPMYSGKHGGHFEQMYLFPA